MGMRRVWRKKRFFNSPSPTQRGKVVVVAPELSEGGVWTWKRVFFPLLLLHAGTFHNCAIFFSFPLSPNPPLLSWVIRPPSPLPTAIFLLLLLLSSFLFFTAGVVGRKVLSPRHTRRPFRNFPRPLPKHKWIPRDSKALKYSRISLLRRRPWNSLSPQLNSTRSIVPARWQGKKNKRLLGCFHFCFWLHLYPLRKETVHVLEREE